MNEKVINDIVWWIPFKKLRNSVKEYLQFSVDLHNNISEINNELINILEINNYVKKIVDITRNTDNLVSTAQNLNKEAFSKYKNINQNKEIVVLGTGPTLNNFIPLDNKLYLGVNRAIFYKNIKLDYFFMSDRGCGENDDIFDYLMNNKPVNLDIFFSILDHNFMKTQISEQYTIDINAKRFVVWHGLYGDSIVYDITSCPLGNFWSIIFPALQFALYTNPKKIYLAGCDATNNGHYYNNTSGLNLPYVLEGWNKIKEFKDIYYPNTEIISINPVGLKGLFDKDIYTKDGIYVDEEGNKINID